MRKITSIPQDLLDKYKRHELTSIQLAKLTGFHPVSLRRAIFRPARIPKTPPNKARLIQARKQYRLTLGHLPAREIAEKAHVSLGTAYRIKATWKKAQQHEPNKENNQP